MRRMILVLVISAVLLTSCAYEESYSDIAAQRIPVPYITVLDGGIYEIIDGSIYRGEETILDGGEYGMYVKGITGWRDRLYFLYSDNEAGNYILCRFGSVKPGEKPRLNLFKSVLDYAAAAGYTPGGLPNNLGLIRVVDGVLLISGDNYASPCAAIEISTGRGRIFGTPSPEHVEPFILYIGSEAICAESQPDRIYLRSYNVHGLAGGKFASEMASDSLTEDHDGGGIISAAAAPDGAIYFTAGHSPGRYGIFRVKRKEKQHPENELIYETSDRITAVFTRGDRLFFSTADAVYHLEDGEAVYFCDTAEKNFRPFFVMNRLYIGRDEYIET